MVVEMVVEMAVVHCEHEGIQESDKNRLVWGDFVLVNVEDFQVISYHFYHNNLLIGNTVADEFHPSLIH